jgi:putative transposase
MARASRHYILLHFRLMDDLAAAYRGWVQESAQRTGCFRDGKWTESVAVGSKEFVTATKEKLGFKAKGREVVDRDGNFELKEAQAAYRGILRDENAVLSPQNQYLWEDISFIST